MDAVRVSCNDSITTSGQCSRPISTCDALSHVLLCGWRRSAIPSRPTLCLRRGHCTARCLHCLPNRAIHIIISILRDGCGCGRLGSKGRTETLAIRADCRAVTSPDRTVGMARSAAPGVAFPSQRRHPTPSSSSGRVICSHGRVYPASWLMEPAPLASPLRSL